MLRVMILTRLLLLFKQKKRSQLPKSQSPPLNNQVLRVNNREPRDHPEKRATSEVAEAAREAAEVVSAEEEVATEVATKETDKTENSESIEKTEKVAEVATEATDKKVSSEKAETEAAIEVVAVAEARVLDNTDQRLQLELKAVLRAELLLSSPRNKETMATELRDMVSRASQEKIITHMIDMTVPAEVTRPTRRYQLTKSLSTERRVKRSS